MLFGFSQTGHAAGSAVPDGKFSEEMGGDLENAANGSNLGGNPTNGSGRAKDSPVSSWKSYFKFPMMDKKTKIFAAMVFGSVAALHAVGAGSQLYSRRRLISAERAEELKRKIDNGAIIKATYTDNLYGNERTGILRKDVRTQKLFVERQEDSDSSDDGWDMDCTQNVEDLDALTIDEVQELPGMRKAHSLPVDLSNTTNTDDEIPDVPNADDEIPDEPEDPQKMLARFKQIKASADLGCIKNFPTEDGHLCLVHITNVGNNGCKKGSHEMNIELKVLVVKNGATREDTCYKGTSQTFEDSLQFLPSYIKIDGQKSWSFTTQRGIKIQEYARLYDKVKIGGDAKSMLKNEPLAIAFRTHNWPKKSELQAEPYWH